jgi:hypothetical protein
MDKWHLENVNNSNPPAKLTSSLCSFVDTVASQEKSNARKTCRRKKGQKLPSTYNMGGGGGNVKR